MPYIREFGAALPARVVDNTEVAALAGCEPAWIEQMTGIRERRWAAAEESVEDLAEAAARDCLARAGCDSSSIGLLIVSTGSASRRFPGPAAEVARRLGMGDKPALDVPIASAGSIFGVTLAAQLAGTYGDVLVVAAEKMSPFARREPVTRNVAILFGDGAGACLIGAGSGRAKIRDAALHSDGSYANDLSLDAEGLLVMNGQTVILQATRKLPGVILEVLDRNAVPAAGVDAFLLHQANQNLIARVARSVGAPSERFFSNIHRYGNTSSASMLIAAAEWSCDHGGFQPGRPVVFAGFGAGFHWGCLLAVGV